MRLLDRRAPRIPAPAPEVVLATGASTWRHSVQVLVHGDLTELWDLGHLDALAAALPTGWTLDRCDSRASPVTDLLVAVVATDADAVVRARLEHPGVPLLAVVGRMADSGQVVAALDAGADACVRTASAPVVASHLLAMQRRRELERVAAFPLEDLTPWAGSVPGLTAL